MVEQFAPKGRTQLEIYSPQPRNAKPFSQPMAGNAIYDLRFSISVIVLIDLSTKALSIFLHPV